MADETLSLDTGETLDLAAGETPHGQAPSLDNSEPGNADAVSQASEGQATERPFLVVHHREEEGGGKFRPWASVSLTPALRTSGLLRALPAEELKTLVCMLTFVTANGEVAPAVFQVGEALRVSPGQAQRRLRALSDFRWGAQPIVIETPREGALPVYVPTPGLIAAQQAPPESGQLPDPPIQPAGRQAVIAHSREHYAHPREEVERDIAERMGWVRADEVPDEAAPSRARVRQLLRVIGLLPDAVDRLLLKFPIERIERQLDWLPYRKARNPLRLLVAAIEHDYTAPADWEEAQRLRATASDDGDEPGGEVEHVQDPSHFDNPQEDTR